MKKALKILLIIILIALIGIFGYYITINIQKNKVLNKVEDTFIAIKNGDLSSYFGDIDKETNNVNNYTKAMLGNLEYKVLEVEPKLNRCKVKLSISNKDMKTVFQKIIVKAMNEAFQNMFDNKSSEEVDKIIEEYFITELNSKELKTVNQNIELEYIKENGKWELTIDRMKFINSILPGYTDLKNSISSLKN